MCCSTGELLISASLSLEKQGRLEWKINPILLSCGDVVLLRGCGIFAGMWYFCEDVVFLVLGSA